MQKTLTDVEVLSRNVELMKQESSDLRSEVMAAMTTLKYVNAKEADQ